MNTGSDQDNNIVDTVSQLTTPAYGSKWHLIGYGIIAPLVICYFAARAWIEEDALWISTEGIAKEHLTGDAAKAMAVVYLCGAAFMNFRWLWGLLGFEKISHAGILLALYIGIGALLTAMAFWVAGA